MESILKTSEPIVISGMSGRFPESDSVDEFAKNLYEKVDMVTEDDRRWPIDTYDINQRMAKIKDIESFDGKYFGIMTKIGNRIDPQARILLETTYEAICDAGVNPQDLCGSQTGVYLGISTFGMPDGVPEELSVDLESSMKEAVLFLPGSGKNFYANRISFLFDFKGPSMVIDTACSSSMVAFDVAVNDLRLGRVDQAIVGTAEINLQPFTNHMFQSLEVNTKDGISRVWDEEAGGFMRGETVASVLLQKKSDAKRIYATVLNSRVNVDGYKRMGMFFPSTDLQKELMIRTYTEANVNPLDVNYFEAHGTGTKVGDLQEARAIYEAYCKGRKGILPIGLLKSCIGHGEAASGLASIVKVLIAFEHKCIPPNLHMKNLKSKIADMSPPLFPINDSFDYEPGIEILLKFILLN